MTRFLLRLASLSALLVAVGCGATPTTAPGEPNKDGPNKDSTPLKPDMTVSAVDLAKDFLNDTAAAEKKYKDKVLKIEGLVEDVDVGPAGMSLRLKGFKAGTNFNSVRCLCTGADADKASGLTPGQKVTVLGKYDRETAGIFVDMTDCQLAEVGKDPAIAVTADELTKAFAIDEKAAEAKYGAKWVTVEGVVVEVQTRDFVNVILEGYNEKDGAKAIRVKATFSRPAK